MQQRIGKLPSVPWLLKIETDSILIKEKRKHLSKTLDRVSKCCSTSAQSLCFKESSHRSIYRYTKFIRYRIVQVLSDILSTSHLLYWVHKCQSL